MMDCAGSGEMYGADGVGNGGESGGGWLIVKGEMRHVLLRDLGEKGERVPVFGDMTFATAWAAFDFVVLEPGGVFEPEGEGPCEEGYVVLNHGAVLEGEGGGTSMQGQVEGTGVLLAPVGLSHRVVNRSEKQLEMLYVRVEMRENQGEAVLRAAEADARVLKWRDAIHGGVGRIATRHIWGPEDFASSWTFMDHAVLEQGSSVGCHYHDALEEVFVILQGRGYMTVDEETVEVGPGSVTWQGIGQGHGIYNPYKEELNFLRLAVAQPDEAYTSIDLHDSLAARRPLQ